MLFNFSLTWPTVWKIGLAFCLVSVVTIVVLVFAVFLKETRTENIVDFYEKLIMSEAERVLTYQFPEDARQYEPQDDTVLDFGTYDFIIVGAGSSGAVIANRLSEVGTWKILLLEAGTFPSNLTEIPSLYAFGCFSDYNWGFKTVPQTTACLGTTEQKCIIPRGRGLGGTTLINGLIYSRGHPTDYNRWADLLNDSSWSYDNVLPYFKKSENFRPTDQEAPIDYAYHGTGGYWNVEHHQPSIPLKYVFLDGNEELGYNITDYNGPKKVGGTVIQYNTNTGKRHDQGTAFILPVTHRNNLQINTESYVTKVDMLNGTVTGVIFTHQGRFYRATANREVILSAGVVSSPHILMLSGIGPQQHLEDLGVPVTKNSSVGLSLRDHIGVFGLQFSSNMTTPVSTLRDQIEAYLNGSGPLTSNTQSHVVGWYKSSIELTPDYPDLELVIDLSSKNSELGQQFLGWNNETWNTLWGNNTSSFYFTLVLLHTHSLGSVKLRSGSPFDFPLLDYNLLSDPDNKDINALYEAINLCMELVNTTAFRTIDARFQSRPLPSCSNYEYLSRDYWYCYIRQVSLAVFHPVGTCPMGTDPLQGAVVDSEFKVFGIRNLRVADSSVFPFTLSSHPSADCAMIGEKVSDLIKLAHL